MCRCTAGRQQGRDRWPHRGCRGRAALGEPAGGRDASEGGSDCRESRCLERDEHRGDLEEKERKREDGKCITVHFYNTWDITQHVSTIDIKRKF